MIQHVNLQREGDRETVYAALQRDFDRDARRTASWGNLAMLLMAGAFVLLAKYQQMVWMGIFVAIMGGWAGVMYIVRFIDNSNRNWAMHVIDWMEENRRQAAEPPHDPDEFPEKTLPLMPESLFRERHK